ncbi:hypothetical protein [Bacillus sp. NPDC094106]|uniref:hypothetical protein n=1 Tax=Bacillus sp. NPDC094106 TaxID=3363949 RepID=UPI0037FB8F4E
MGLQKSEWAIVRDAEEQGLVVAMTSHVIQKRTELNNQLSDYFREKCPNYPGVFQEDICEDVLDAVNEYIKDNKIEKYPYELDFPITSGSQEYLVPIGENIELKVVVADEYHGDGEYSKYLMINFFLMNENTSKEDIDILIEFVKEYLLSIL